MLLLKSNHHLLPLILKSGGRKSLCLPGIAEEHVVAGGEQEAVQEWHLVTHPTYSVSSRYPLVPLVVAFVRTFFRSSRRLGTRLKQVSVYPCSDYFLICISRADRQEREREGERKIYAWCL